MTRWKRKSTILREFLNDRKQPVRSINVKGASESSEGNGNMSLDKKGGPCDTATGRSAQLCPAVRRKALT